MLIDFLNNQNDIGLLILRIAIGIVFIIHGIKKFGTWKQQTGDMLNTMKFLSIVEPLGGLAVLLGFLTQAASIGLGIIMIGAIFMKINTWKKEFTGDGGWEFDFINLAVLLALLILGAGRISADYLLQI